MRSGFLAASTLAILSSGCGLFIGFDEYEAPDRWEFEADGPIEYAMGLAVTPSGDTLATARFTGKADFGGTTLEHETSQIALVKLDKKGKFLWAKGLDRAEGSLTIGSVIATEDEGFVLGGRADASGAVDLGNGLLGGGGAGTSTFGVVARYDAEGDPIWSHAIETVPDPDGGGNLDLMAVAVGPDGQIALAGSFSGELNVVGRRLKTAAGAAFVAELDASGDVRWARAFFDESEHAAVTGVRYASDGTLIANGYFSAEATFPEIHLQPPREADTFLLGLGSKGSIVWAKPIATAGDDFPSAIDAGATLAVASKAAGELDLQPKVVDMGKGGAYLAFFDPKDGHLLGNATASGSADVLGLLVHPNGKRAALALTNRDKLTIDGETRVVTGADPEGVIVTTDGIGHVEKVHWYDAGTTPHQFALSPDGKVVIAGERGSTAQPFKFVVFVEDEWK